VFRSQSPDEDSLSSDLDGVDFVVAVSAVSIP